MDNNYLEIKRVRSIVDELSKHYQIIHIFNPISREQSERYIVYDNYTIPNQVTHAYSVMGKDITNFIAKQVAGNVSDLEGILKTEIDYIEKKQYSFGKDYSFEIVR